ncbi:MAG: TIGR03987 family protein [bacterium]|jgi:uncharacterized repeat protein (TIGR03987 family)|nr:TIGR03987 family protein [bacterium]MBK9777907.1 TIGR03987 family protein [bacterium]
MGARTAAHIPELDHPVRTKQAPGHKVADPAQRSNPYPAPRPAAAGGPHEEPVTVIVSTTLISLALVFYSIGVWAERLARYLKPWHVVAFWMGLAFDISGTLAMHALAEGPFDLRDPHTLTGQLALWLMLAHAIWATRVARRGSEADRAGFHRYSLVVWIFWLVPYFGGMALGMRG